MNAKVTTKVQESAPKGATGVDSRVKTDWEAVERDYRAGILSYAEMGKVHGVTKGRICIVAKKNGWTQDLSAKIKAKAEAKVNAATVNAEVNEQRLASTAETIEIGATVLARVKMSHRTDIGRSRTLAMHLLEELEQQTAQVPELAQLGELMAAPDEKGVDKLNELYHKVISLPMRTKTMKDLGDTLKTLIALERQAFGLDDAPPAETDPLSALLGRIATGNSSAFKPVVDDPEREDRP